MYSDEELKTIRYEQSNTCLDILWRGNLSTTINV